jgi:hypothetical protein
MVSAWRADTINVFYSSANFRPGQQIGQPRMQTMGQGFQTPQRQI